MERLIANYRETGSVRTAETYRCALNRFSEFRGGEDIAIADVSAELMRRYERYLKDKGLSLNTVSFYLRKLRAAYNKAVDAGLTADSRPFKHVYTGIPKTAKRALPLRELRAIRLFRSADADVCFARDMFLFSFFTRGMSFVDMAYLKRSDVKDGCLSYKRHKTGQLIVLRWEPCMQDIVDRYPVARGPFLLPIIHTPNGKERSQYRNKQNCINRQLKRIARAVGLNANLTMYVARHSWANIAKQMNTPLEVISNGMGHTSERTTKIYLNSLGADKIDRANARIIRLLDETYPHVAGAVEGGERKG